MNSNYAWYAIHTKPREEYRARDNLRRQGYRVFLPFLKRECLRGGRRTVAREPLFSRYLFVSLSEIDSNWYPMRSTRGVHRIVEFGHGPVPVPSALIEGLQDKLPQTQPRFRSGDRVCITQGSFKEIEAIYAAPDGEARAFLLLNFMGAERKLSFPLEAIR
jgi:transcriptional antiterminator RfaH